jgi:hypothetical protein
VTSWLVVSQSCGVGPADAPFQSLSRYGEPAPATGEPLTLVTSPATAATGSRPRPYWPSAPMLSKRTNVFTAAGRVSW